MSAGLPLKPDDGACQQADLAAISKGWIADAHSCGGGAPATRR